MPLYWMVDPNCDLRFWNAEKGVDVDAGDGADEEVMLSWFRVLRGKWYRDRIVVNSLLATRGVSIPESHNMDKELSYDLARVLRRFLLSLRTRFFLHLALTGW